MLTKKRKPRSKHNSNLPKTRKQLRKEARKNKKIRRHEYYVNRKKPAQFVPTNKPDLEKPDIKDNFVRIHGKPKNYKLPDKLESEKIREKERKKQKKLQEEMYKQRKNQLLEANLEEDRNIKHLEKQLKINKRKSKAVPTSFTADGLDYLLEVCDSENLKTSALAEQQFTEVNDEFEEDLALMTGNDLDTNTDNNSYTSEDESFNSDVDNSHQSFRNNEKQTFLKTKKRISEVVRSDLKKRRKESGDSSTNNFNDDVDAESNIDNEDDDEADVDNEDEADFDNEDDEAVIDNDNDEADIDNDDDDEAVIDNDDDDDEAVIDNDDDDEAVVDNDDEADIDDEDEAYIGNEAKADIDNEDDTANDDVDSDDEGDDEGDVLYKDEFNNSSDEGSSNEKVQKRSDDGTWEDIYGRLRTKEGSIIKENNQKYLPPAARKLKEDDANDNIRNQKLQRLKKQLKGLINRLAESNMHSIATQIEELYMNNSRNDMNNAITNLILEALVTSTLTPERLLMEHVLLVTILHANVGTEVGAHFLQTIVKQFDEHIKEKNTENKKLINAVVILAQLYNFKLFDSKLIFEILNKLADSFEEKDVECILHILRNVGFNLRKDSPLALKELILNLQKKAVGVSDDSKNNSRVKFMLDVLLAIKNNNVSKIPNYDTTYSEHLKKIMKGFIRKGHYVTQLNISLEDLLKVEEKGRWWVIGSAWHGNTSEDKEIKNEEKTSGFSQNLLELARKQRMNTDTRKNIFCIIMSAEDYLDAFQKLLRLSLKNQQEREIIHVLLHCCLREKKYNPFYAVLAQKFCEHDRKYQMTIKYSVWDKLKTLKEHSANQISNLAKLLSYLFMEKGLSISALKVVQFSDLDKVTLRFIRQILLKIILHEDLEVCKGVFDKISQSQALKMFRESLRLFMHHFLLRNLKSQEIPDDQKRLLQERVQFVEKLLMTKENKDFKYVM